VRHTQLIFADAFVGFADCPADRGFRHRLVLEPLSDLRGCPV
jgi:hypothetical protein